MISEDVKPCDLVDRCLSARRHIPQKRHLHPHLRRKLRYFAFFFVLLYFCLLPVIYYFGFFFSLSYSFFFHLNFSAWGMFNFFWLSHFVWYLQVLSLPLTPPLCCLPVGLTCFSPELPQPVAHLWRRSCHCSTAIFVWINLLKPIGFFTYHQV